METAKSWASCEDMMYVLPFLSTYFAEPNPPETRDFATKSEERVGQIDLGDGKSERGETQRHNNLD
jgi:hypothetical protein